MQIHPVIARHGWLIAIAVAYLYVFPYFPKIKSANELPRIYLVKAIADEHGFAIDRGVKRWGSTGDVSPSGGHQYSNKAPGSSMLAAPPYLAARLVAGEPSLEVTFWIARVFTGVIPMLGFLVLLYGFLARVAPNPAIRKLVLVAYALGSMAMTYSILFYSHQLAAICAASAWIVALDVVDGRRRPRAMLAAGVLAGAAPLVDYQALFAMLPVAVHVVARLIARRSPAPPPVAIVVRGGEATRPEDGASSTADAARADGGAPLSADAPREGGVPVAWTRDAILRVVGLAAIGAAIPIAILLGYHDACFGSPWRTGYDASTVYAHHHQAGFLGITELRWEAFAGSLFTPDNGLFALAPWLLLAIPGAWIAWRHREHRGLAVVGVGVALIYILFISSINFWRGGWEVGPRYITAMLPFLLPLVAAALQAWRGKPVAFAIAAVTIAIGVAVYVLSSATFPYWPDSFKHPLVDVTFQLVGDDLVAPNVASAIGIEGLPGLAPYLVVAFGLLARAIDRASSWRIVAVAFAGAFAVILTYALAIESGAPSTLRPYNFVRASVIEAHR